MSVMTGHRLPTMVSLLWHESRRCGPAVWALPVAGVVAGAAMTLFPSMARSNLLLAFCTALAALAGLCVAAVLGRERMLELHLSLPVPVPALVARRLAIVAALTVVAGAAAGGVALASGGGGAEAALAVLCVAAPFTGVVLWTWARRRSTAAASGALIAVWLGYALFWANRVPPEVGRPVCAVVGALLLWRGLRALDDPDRVLAEEAR